MTTHALPLLDDADVRRVEDTYEVPTYARLPLTIVRGEGSYVYDAAGRRYLDLYGGHCVALVGHCHPRVVRAVQEQAARLMFYSNVVYSDVRARAVQAVVSLAPPGLARVFFCNSGTEANETALKMARKATGRRHVVSMTDGFHGRTLGSLGATGLAKFHEDVWPIPTEHVYVPYGDLDALRAAMGDHVAAVMLEPIPSMGGVRCAPPEYFAGLRALCDAHGALLVYDEIQTGFGRTGAPFFGSDPAARPDLITAAKGVAGGVPAGLVLVREDISAAIKVNEHGTTFGGGPLASAAIAAVVDVLARERLVEHAGTLGAWLVARLSAIPGVLSVTGRGLLLGVNLDRPAKDVVTALRGHGMLTGSCPCDERQIRLMPPLVLTREEAGDFADALAAVLAGTLAGPRA